MNHLSRRGFDFPKRVGSPCCRRSDGERRPSSRTKASPVVRSGNVIADVKHELSYTSDWLPSLVGAGRDICRAHATKMSARITLDAELLTNLAKPV